MYVNIVFHSPELPRVSPMVSVWWTGTVIELLNLVPSPVWCNGNMPEGRCADFVGACYSLPGVDTNRVEVCNVPVPREWLDGAGGFGWYNKLVREMAAWDKPPVLVSLDPPYAVTRGGVELCRRDPEWRGPGHPLWMTSDPGQQ